MKSYKVRVTINDEQREKWEELIDWLRYAGVIGVEKNVVTQDILYFSIMCPKHIPKYNMEQWAKSNCQRIKSFASGAKVEVVEVK